MLLLLFNLIKEVIFLSQLLSCLSYRDPKRTQCWLSPLAITPHPRPHRTINSMVNNQLLPVMFDHLACVYTHYTYLPYQTGNRSQVLIFCHCTVVLMTPQPDTQCDCPCWQKLSLKWWTMHLMNGFNLFIRLNKCFRPSLCSHIAKGYH